MLTIYIYSNLDGRQVANYTGADNAECEAWAEQYGSDDYHSSYADVAVSDAVAPGSRYEI